MAGSGRRVALEVIFLTGLAVAAGLADLTTSQIIGVVALGWVVTVLIELVSWRLAVRHPAGVAVAQPLPESRADAVEAPPLVPEAEPLAEPEPQAAKEPEPAPRKRGLFRRAQRDEAPGPVEEPVEQPRHVRLIERSDDVDAGTHETPEQRAEGA
jgi:hypothetical protein